MLNPKSRISDATVTVLAAVAVLSLAACSGDAPSLTGPSAGATGAAETTVIVSAALDDVEAGGQRTINFNLPHAGALAVTVRWTDSNNSVTAVLTGADCAAFNEGAAHCQGQRSVEREGREGREGGEGQEGVIEQPSASGAYHLLLQNEGPGTETIRVTGVLTSPYRAPTPTPYPTPYPTPTPNYPPPYYPNPNPYGTNDPGQRQ